MKALEPAASRERNASRSIILAFLFWLESLLTSLFLWNPFRFYE